jgi:hypothetical protein
MHDIDSARHESIASAGAGFPFLFSFGLTWIAAGVLSYFLSPKAAAWAYIFQAAIAIPMAFALQGWMRYPKASPDNPLWPLAMQLLFIQPLAFPAYILVLFLEPSYVPAVFAAMVGAHFLPYQWLHKTRLYGVLGVLVSAGPWMLAVAFGLESRHYTGFFVGAVLLVGSFFAKAHAARYV